MNKKSKRILALLLVCVLSIMLVACNNETPASTGTTDAATATPTATVQPTQSQEPDSGNDIPLVVGIATLSQKFSNFFSTTAFDRDVAELTGVGMLTTDRTGGIIYNAIEGETVSFEGTDYFYDGIANVAVTRDEAADTTTYNIKIRDDVRFSDGEYLDADDIIFTYYVYLDPSYVGSTTLNSYPIQGLKNYQANNSMADSVDVAGKLEEIKANPTEDDLAFFAGLVEGLLAEELEWVKTLYGNANYDSYTTAHPVAKDLFAFFYAIDEEYDSSAVESEEQVLADIVAQYGSDYVTLADAYGSATYFDEDLNAYALTRALEGVQSSEVPNITGIRKISQTEVEVVLDGFSAPAIYSVCGIMVQPMHYYGDEAQYNYDNNQFGFPRGDLSLIESKTSHPMGAGPYKFIKYENKVVYYEANEFYWKGEVATKSFQYKETVDADMIPGVGTDTIDIANPSGSKDKFNEIASYNSNGESSGDVITTSAIDNLGYGYIGLNAKTMNVAGVPDSEESKSLRKGFATVFAVYRDVAVDSYYGEAANVINYPISNTSWAAPQKTDEDYKVAFSTKLDGTPIYTADMTQEQKYAAALDAAVEYFKAAGYTWDDATSKFTSAPEGALMEYEIIIPGDGTGDHPAFGILTDTRAALEQIGIRLDINDPADSNVLWNKIDTAEQHMWTAAWQSTIDPDMYQVYHSSNITGAGGSDSNRYHITSDALDQYIMDGRTSSDQEYRKAIYKAALEEIIDWAVEIPTYQRQNVIIFSTPRVNMDTVTGDITTYWGWAGEIESLEMNK